MILMALEILYSLMLPHLPSFAIQFLLITYKFDKNHRLNFLLSLLNSSITYELNTNALPEL